jgi:hypothetical protein
MFPCRLIGRCTERQQTLAGQVSLARGHARQPEAYSGNVEIDFSKRTCGHVGSVSAFRFNQIATSSRGRFPRTFAWSRERPLPWRLVMYGALVLAGFSVAGAAGLQPVGGDAPMIFQIPAQPLATALQAYGQRAGVQVLYESDSAAGRQSVAVEGEFTRNEALKLLLSRTNLEVHYTRSDAITLAPRGVRAKDAPPADPLVKADLSIGELRVRASSQSVGSAPLHDYSECVQLDIQTALRKNAKTRSASPRSGPRAAASEICARKLGRAVA